MKRFVGSTLAAVSLLAAAAGPAAAQSATVNAVDSAFQDAANPGSATVTVGTGDDVRFAYPDGGLSHNVDFDGPQPASCTQTAGPVPPGPVPPLPATASTEGWAGTCRFDVADTYTFYCQAHNFMTGAVVVEPDTPTATPPGPPGGVTATAGDGRATVSFTAPPANGAPIDRYTVTASPGGAQATGAASPVTVTGLANGTSYTFRVTATNAAGTGAPSAPSNAVTPAAAAQPAPTPTPSPSPSPDPPAQGTGPAGAPPAPASAPSNAFTVARVRAKANGVVTFDAKLPGPGRLTVLATYAGTDRAFARLRLDQPAAGTVRVRVRPGAAGRRALRRRARPPRLDLRVGYTPAGGTQRTLTRRGVRIPRE